MVELSDKFQLLTRLPNFGIKAIYYLSTSESVSRIVPDGVSTGYPTSRTAIPSLPPNDEGDRQSQGERPRRTDRGGPLSNEPPVLGGYPLLDRVVQTVGRMTRDRLVFSWR